MPIALVGIVSVVFLALAGVLARHSITAILSMVWQAIPTVNLGLVHDIFGGLRRALQSAAADIEHWGERVAQPFADALGAPVNAAVWLFNVVTRTFQALVHAVEHVVTVTIPGVYADLFSRLVGVAQHLQHNLNVAQDFLFERLIGVRDALQSNINRLATITAGAVAGAIGLARHDLAVAQDFLFAKTVQVATDLQHNINTLAAEAAHAISSTAAETLQAAEQVAARDAAEAAHLLNVGAATVAAGAIGGLLTDVETLGRDMAGGFADVRGAIADIPAAIPADIAAALATSALATRALTRLARECTVPNCRTVNGAKGFLESLLSGVELDAFIALVAALAADPARAAQRIDEWFGPVTREAETIGKGLLGLVNR